MAEFELFAIGLVVVGFGLTLKVIRDGLYEIKEFKLRVTECRALIVECEENTVKLQGEVAEQEKELQDLKNEVQKLELKEQEASSTIKTRKEAEGQKTITKFKVDQG